MLYLLAIIASAIGIGLIFATYQYLQKTSAASIGQQRAEFDDQIKVVDSELNSLLKFKDSYAAAGQYKQIASALEGLRAELDGDKEKLKDLESKLEELQTTVELKESHQQEVKSSRDDDEEKLEKLMEEYQAISDESIALEQQLAQSMKNIDSIVADVEFSEEHKAMVDELSEAMSLAGETLRNLLTDYQAVNERLTLLREQHSDLEDEYTRLVEQQLGE